MFHGDVNSQSKKMFHGNVNSLHKALMLFTAMMLTPVFGEAQPSEEPQQLPQQISLKSQSADDSAADGGKPLTGMSHGDVNSLIQGMYHQGNVNFLVENPHRISTLCVFVAVVGYLTAMFQGRGNHTGTYNSEGNTTEGPSWDPAGRVPFRTWINEVHATKRDIITVDTIRSGSDHTARSPGKC